MRLPSVPRFPISMSSDTTRSLCIRKFSQRKQRWAHTTNGRSKLAQLHANQNARNDVEFSSSGSSEPPSPTTPTTPSTSASSLPILPSSVQIITWNIDFMTPNTDTRMTAALDHIQREVLDCSDGRRPEPCVILLQEVTPDSLQAILQHPWVRSHFLSVPVKSEVWPSATFAAYGLPVYGNATLISRDIPVLSARTLHFGSMQTIMGRHALAVDLCLRASGKLPGKARGESPPDRDVTLRVANVHLESLPIGASMRPVQLKAVAELLREEGVYTGVVCGDMNAISAADADIHQQAGLVDAWTGSDTDTEGFTWGYQPECEFPPGRLDKIFYTSGKYCEVEIPRRIGVGLQTTDGEWVSDHYGLISMLRILEQPASVGDC